MKLYCKFCGRQLILELQKTGEFDRFTGKEIIIKTYQCPKYRGFFGFMHDWNINEYGHDLSRGKL